jgi:hypothetical protein
VKSPKCACLRGAGLETESAVVHRIVHQAAKKTLKTGIIVRFFAF